MDAPRSVGLPYGSYPRLILAYLTTEAVRKKTSEIDLGRSPNDFVRKLGLTPISGPRRTTHRVQEKLQRLVSTRLSWETTKNFRSKECGSGFLMAAEPGLQRFAVRFLRQQPSWHPKLRLGRELFQEMTRSAVPVDLRAVHLLKGSPLAIDIYAWLTYRMSYLRRPCRVPWRALENQFGAAYGRPRDFRRRFLAHLCVVARVYPEVRARQVATGMMLYPSPPHTERQHFGQLQGRAQRTHRRLLGNQKIDELPQPTN